LALPFSFPLIIDCNLLLRLKIYFIEYRQELRPDFIHVRSTSVQSNSNCIGII
jgi:hypothetical protein